MRNFRMSGAAPALAVPLRGGGVFPIPAPVGENGCPAGESVRERGLISKQPPQGHYGKITREAVANAMVFRSSTHKGIMERRRGSGGGKVPDFEAAPTRALWKVFFRFRFLPLSYFEAAPTRALWKDFPRRGLLSRPISKPPPHGHYGKGGVGRHGSRVSFRSSPHKGIMERSKPSLPCARTHFEAAPTRALWKAKLPSYRRHVKISKQPPQGHYGKPPATAEQEQAIFRSSPHKGIMESA